MLLNKYFCSQTLLYCRIKTSVVHMVQLFMLRTSKAIVHKGLGLCGGSLFGRPVSR